MDGCSFKHSIDSTDRSEKSERALDLASGVGEFNAARPASAVSLLPRLLPSDDNVSMKGLSLLLFLPPPWSESRDVVSPALLMRGISPESDALDILAAPV